MRLRQGLLASPRYPVDNACVTQVKTNPIPLPAAVLALSVAVCIGAAGQAQASDLRAYRTTQAEQRQTIEHLLDAIQQAARKLTDRLDGQAIAIQRGAIRPTLALTTERLSTAEPTCPATPLLREALLNLPPPAC